MAKVGTCVGCKEEREVVEFRAGTVKCGDCLCEQLGRSLMDCVRKGLAGVEGPVHILVANSGGAGSGFASDLIRRRVRLDGRNQKGAIKRIDDFHMDDFSLPGLVAHAQANGYNCVILGETADFIAANAVAHIASGRVETLPYIAADDKTSYAPVVLLRPARQCLHAEAEFYCTHRQVQFDNCPSPIQTAFPEEFNITRHLLAEGQGGTPFAVQRMCEKLPRIQLPCVCPICRLPASNGDAPCIFCAAH